MWLKVIFNEQVTNSSKISVIKKGKVIVVKKILSISITVVLIAMLLAINVFAIQYPSTTYTLGASNNNTLMLTPLKSTGGTTYDSFKWESGTANSFKIFIKTFDESTWISDKVNFPSTYRNDNTFHIIYYRAGLSIASNTLYKVFGEQSNVASKTVKGIFWAT